MEELNVIYWDREINKFGDLTPITHHDRTETQAVIRFRRGPPPPKSRRGSGENEDWDWGGDGEEVGV